MESSEGHGGAVRIARGDNCLVKVPRPGRFAYVRGDSLMRVDRERLEAAFTRGEGQQVVQDLQRALGALLLQLGRAGLDACLLILRSMASGTGSPCTNRSRGSHRTLGPTW